MAMSASNPLLSSNNETDRKNYGTAGNGHVSSANYAPANAAEAARTLEMLTQLTAIVDAADKAGNLQRWTNEYINDVRNKQPSALDRFLNRITSCSGTGGSAAIVGAAAAPADIESLASAPAQKQTNYMDMLNSFWAITGSNTAWAGTAQFITGTMDNSNLAFAAGFGAFLMCVITNMTCKSTQGDRMAVGFPEGAWWATALAWGAGGCSGVLALSSASTIARTIPGLENFQPNLTSCSIALFLGLANAISSSFVGNASVVGIMRFWHQWCNITSRARRVLLFILVMIVNGFIMLSYTMAPPNAGVRVTTVSSHDLDFEPAMVCLIENTGADCKPNNPALDNSVYYCVLILSIIFNIGGLLGYTFKPALDSLQTTEAFIVSIFQYLVKVIRCLLPSFCLPSSNTGYAAVDGQPTSTTEEVRTENAAPDPTGLPASTMIAIFALLFAALYSLAFIGFTRSTILQLMGALATNKQFRTAATATAVGTVGFTWFARLYPQAHGMTYDFMRYLGVCKSERQYTTKTYGQLRGLTEILENLSKTQGFAEYNTIVIRDGQIPAVLSIPLVRTSPPQESYKGLFLGMQEDDCNFTASKRILPNCKPWERDVVTPFVILLFSDDDLKEVIAKSSWGTNNASAEVRKQATVAPVRHTITYEVLLRDPRTGATRKVPIIVTLVYDHTKSMYLEISLADQNAAHPAPVQRNGHTGSINTDPSIRYHPGESSTDD